VLRAVIELREASPQAAGFSVAAIAAELGWEPARVRREARRMTRAALAQLDNDHVRLTEKGTADGTFIVKSHRLWEHYLVYRDILAADHVDRPADEVEHLLTPELLLRLEEILEKDHGLDPKRVVNIHESGSGYRGRRAAS